MKLATEQTCAPDGRLLVVSRNLKRAAVAPVPTLQAALDDWSVAQAELEALYERLNDGSDGFTFRPEAMAAPLPRAWQWLDGSAFPSHGALMQQAFNLPPIETDRPLMYQGMSHRFLSGTEAVPFPSESDGIDFEGELGIITDAVPMGSSPDDALGYIRLAVLINDWSLRTIAPVEMKTGFGWVQAKPACSVAPVAVTLDELGSEWSDGRMALTLSVDLNGRRFGEVAATDMEYGFHELVAHAARTRGLCAGTIIGSGTVSSPGYLEVGSCCIAERRAIEAIESGAPQTGFMRFGDRVRMEARSSNGQSLFGTIDQTVAAASR